MTEVLLVTKGHPFDAAAMDDLLVILNARSNRTVGFEHVSHPAAQARLHPDRVDADVVLFYDMPGIAFQRGAAPTLVEPSEELKAGIRALGDAGVPLVFWHHAMAGWPAWDEYAEITHAKFSYVPHTWHGRELPDSGYRHHVAHTARVVAPGHPVVEGLGDGFDLVDELYLCCIDEAAVTPLLRSSATFTREHFSSALEAVITGRVDVDPPADWAHPDGSDLVAWTHTWRNSRVVCIQPGDGPETYRTSGFQRLLLNALRYAAGTGV
jgi:hypothetical protein